MEPEEQPEEPKLKKALVLIGGIFLLLLMFSYVFVTYPISNIIIGQLESTPLNENVLDLENFKIILENNTEKKLQKFYFAEQRVEWSACLQGRKNGNYFITNVYQPKTNSQGFNHVNFEPCKDTLIILHTHPYKSCVASTTDINTLKRTQKTNPDALMVIMCEPARFSVYN